MITRIKGQRKTKRESLASLRAYARKKIRDGGWTQRAIAMYINRSQTHICLVLTGKRDSRYLLELIAQLPSRL